VLVPLAVLPIGAIAFTVYLLRPSDEAFAPLRLALVRAGVLVGALTVVSVEILGALNALTPLVVALTWGVGFVASFTLAVRQWVRGGRRRPQPVARVRLAWARCSRLERVLLVAVVGLMLAELLVAVLSPPNNYDSMTYHLPKIEHWVVQRDVGFFATRIHRQDSFAPGAEYLLLQLRLLTGGSTVYNLLQWTAGLACALVASRIAGQLGGDRRAQLLTAFVVGTTPMVVMESSSTQTDLVVAAWVICLGTLVLDELRRRTTAVTVLLLGAAAGLVTLTKATGLLGAGPLLLLWGLAQLRLAHSAELHTLVRRVARTVLASIALVAVALVVAGPYLHREDAAFDNPLGPDYSRQSISMQRHDPAAVLVNGLRLAHTVFNTPVTAVNRVAADAVDGVAHAIHVDPNDPRITFAGATFPYLSWRPDEDSVSYPVQAAVVLLGALFLAIRTRRVVGHGSVGAARAYALAFWLAVLLYPIMVKWQPWGNRLFLFALVMGGPMAGLWLDSVLRRATPATTLPDAVPNATAAVPDATAAVQAATEAVPNTPEAVPTGSGGRRRRVAAWAATGALVVGGAAGWLAVGYGWPRRLVGGGSVFTTHGADAMFNRRPGWLPDYEYVAAQVRASGAKRIGLAQDSNSWEYPWWYLMPGTALEAVQSQLPQYPAAHPADMDAVICTVPQGTCKHNYVPAGWTLHWHGSAGYALPPGR
jgi:hypothetical protein